ncbi:ATP-binding cassette domain-containing protein [Maribacter chungangensis]|uniref:ATP-binding cassette domain-containing protein n=1 Tax=Maribacter chungangensis TaxID=1069117 RepID=A0ABW3B0Q3_9FLAO
MTLELDNIELNFDSKKILSGIYMHAETGTVTGVLGRNGCGKTSLLRILFGNLGPKYGNVRLNGLHQKRKLYKTGKAAYLPQHRLLPSYMTVQEAFETFKTDRKDFTTLFHSFVAPQKEKINNLSTGELRLLETYLILNSKKEIIILDEPFSFIAPIYIDILKKIICQKKENSIIILTDHYYEDILDISDTLYLLKNGCSKALKSKVELKQEGYLT